ncbi:hypothetical protein BDR26DRAFT_437129 [Obelidium mucronatum]|nr:hypothetical protein BDR26DRAFT_437129 [Obelidium mucronatum]
MSEDGNGDDDNNYDDDDDDTDSSSESVNSSILPNYVMASNPNQQIIGTDSSISINRYPSALRSKVYKPSVVAQYAARKAILKMPMAHADAPDEKFSQRGINKSPDLPSSGVPPTTTPLPPPPGPVPIQPRQIQEQVSLMYHTYLVWLLIPAFDIKGRKLTMDQFDLTDFDDITFLFNGLHPKSYFSTMWDFMMTILYFICLWIIPFIVCYNSDISIEFSLYLSLIVSTIFALDSIISLLTPQPSSINVMCSFQGVRVHAAEH